MITLDIAGFYYGDSFPADGIITVLDLMNKARQFRTKNGGVLDFMADEKKQFIETISVTYDRLSNPESRQKGLPDQIPARRPTGLYSFTDDVFDPSNRIMSNGRVPGLHAWQYYITSAGGVLKSRTGGDLMRGIAPAGESNKPPFGVSLDDGDTVTWRLIAIFGLNAFFDSQREMLLARSGGRPLGFKAALEIMKTENINFSDFMQ